MKRILFSLALLAGLSAHAQYVVTLPSSATPATCVAAASAAGGSCSVPYVAPVVIPPVVVPPVVTGVSIISTGAKCDGKTDDLTAINAAITQGKQRSVPVIVPAATCAYSNVITLNGVVMKGSGTASVLKALDPAHIALYLTGSGSQVRSLRLSAPAVARCGSGHCVDTIHIVPSNASNWVVDSVAIDGGNGAGILSSGSTNGTVNGNTITGTLADSIHMTGGTSFVTITNNTITASGDDGIAVVSYQSDGALTHDITATGNSVTGNLSGRGMSVVGGQNVTYSNNRVTNSGAYACIYLAQENAWNTYGDTNVTASNNTLTNCGSNTTGHGAIMLFSDGALPNTGVKLIRNDIVQQGQPGIREWGPGTGLVLDSNRINGANPATQIVTPGVTVTPYTSGPVGAQ